jgi:hypothetical protein
MFSCLDFQPLMVAFQSGAVLDDAKPRAPSHSCGGCQALQRDELRSARVEDEPFKLFGSSAKKMLFALL